MKGKYFYKIKLKVYVYVVLIFLILFHEYLSNFGYKNSKIFNTECTIHRLSKKKELITISAYNKQNFEHNSMNCALEHLKRFMATCCGTQNKTVVS